MLVGCSVPINYCRVTVTVASFQKHEKKRWDFLQCFSWASLIVLVQRFCWLWTECDNRM